MEVLSIRRDEGITILTIQREQALNALNGEVMDALYSFFTETEFTPGKDLGVIVTGSGAKAFAAGADIKQFLSLDIHSAAEFAKKGQHTFDAIETCLVPVVAAVNGFALGGGCELAMACHMRIAGENARFGQPEVNLGLIPGYGGTQRLHRLVGRTKATELLMTGDMVDAKEALTLGLVNRVVPAGEEVEEARRLLEKIASKAPLAIRGIIECVNAYEDGTRDGFAAEREIFAGLFDSKDLKEGVGAFLTKRKAHFTGE